MLAVSAMPVSNVDSDRIKVHVKQFRLKAISYLSSIFLLLILVRFVFAQTIDIGLFSQGNLSAWYEESFVGNTQYQLIEDEQGLVLEAFTEASASGLFRTIDIDLSSTPYLNWSWKVENIYSENDELSRSGDDYPVRIFVVVSGGIFFWNTRAVNYVWSSNQAVGSRWESAVTRNAMMLAVNSGDAELGQWRYGKRNIREDFKNFFDIDITEINAIAIMSDSDNTGQSARAYYGDIFFSAQ
jgi:hypothetical protein